MTESTDAAKRGISNLKFGAIDVLIVRVDKHPIWIVHVEDQFKVHTNWTFHREPAPRAIDAVIDRHRHFSAGITRRN